MEMGDGYRNGSMRMNSSTFWRRGDEIFSRSGRDNDDEEALRWAALEKLPTYDRVRKGLLNIGGEHKEVDILGLGFQERKNLLDRLVRVTEEDNEKFLLKLKDRIDRVGLDFPTIEVRYEHLNIDAEAYVGSRGLPSFVNSIFNAMEAFGNYLHILPNKKKSFTILHDVSGIIKPRRLTLLLGPPGSGKTTLLLALAGKLSSDLKVSGSVTYNGHGMNEFVPQRTAAYISQHDLHIGEMTVRETLAFSARCQGVGTRYDMLTELVRREKAANIKPDSDIDVFMKAVSVGGKETSAYTDYILKILGLDICADMMVGNEMLRGISGGQRKRLTTGEMIVGPARALFMDEISTGLDSSTTYQIVNSFRQAIHILGATAVISLLQPAPETYDLFDDIILLSDGQVVYQGPREHVLEFFESMGFKCPERKGVADFLQEVTSIKDQQQYWVRRDEPYRFLTVKEFAEAFHSFHVGRRLGGELSTQFDKKMSHPATLSTYKYGVSKKELLKACTERELLLMKRNSFVYAFRAFQRDATLLHEERVVDLIAARPGMKILDVGCGVGGPMRAIAARSGSDVVGITINEYQVGRARAHNKKAGLDSVCEVVCGNFLSMPFENESFDGAYSIEATCHAPKLEDVYGEIFRVLKPGAMYVSYEWVTTELYNAGDEDHVEIIQGIERGDALPGLRAYNEVAEIARKVGFEVVDERDLAKAPGGPWWTRLKMGRIAYWRNHLLVTVMTFLRIAPKGVVEVHEMLYETAMHLTKGGDSGIFTPMHMILCRKPESAAKEEKKE